MRPVLIINPTTGRQTYTKHPERLIARRQARQERAQLTIIERMERVKEDFGPRFWNGSRGSDKMHMPGEVRS